MWFFNGWFSVVADVWIYRILIYAPPVEESVLYDFVVATLKCWNVLHQNFQPNFYHIDDNIDGDIISCYFIGDQLYWLTAIIT